MRYRYPDHLNSSSRRHFLRQAGTLGIGGMLGVAPLAALTADNTVTLQFGNGERPLVKYPQKRPLIRLTARPPQLETPFSVFDENIITPNDAFFVRYHLAGILTSIDPAGYRIAVQGKIATPLSLSVDDLKKQFEPIEYIAVNQCSGNSRGFFDPRVRGRYSESDAVLREALAVSLEHGSNTSPRACGLRQKIGQNLRLEHRYAEAIEQLQSLIKDACTQSSRDNDIWRPQVLANLSEAQLDAGDAVAADIFANTAMAYARKAFPPRHFRLGTVLFAQARTRLALGKPRRSRTAAARSAGRALPPASC